MTLSYAYMLSFSRIFEPHISAVAWPIAWIVLFVVVMIDPFPLMHSHSRFWLVWNWSKLLMPGLYPVEVRTVSRSWMLHGLIVVHSSLRTSGWAIRCVPWSILYRGFTSWAVRTQLDGMT